jgi:hypothetical protein
MKHLKENLTLIALSTLALILFVGHLQLTPRAEAAATERAGDFQLVTAQIATGGDGVYVIDNRNGIVALFMWNNSTRRIEPKNVRFLSELLQDSPANR